MRRDDGIAAEIWGAIFFGLLVWSLVSFFSPSSAVAPKIHGALNPDVTQSTIHETICVSGYSSAVRPSYRWSSAFKYALSVRQDVSPRDYELDHLIPLELGGAPRAAQNLWLEPWSQAHESDPEENRLHAEVCRGEISLAWAQHKILNVKGR